MTTDRDSGYLTVFSHDGSEIYGEFAGARHEVERPSGRSENHIFSGDASEGTFETFRRLNMAGIERVRYRFEGNGSTMEGEGRLLAMESANPPVSAIVRIEAL